MKVPVGEWIRQQRAEKSKTQFDLSKACDTDVGNVSRWERGLVVPKADAFKCICELLGVDIADAYKAVEFVAPNAPKKAERAAVATATTDGADSSDSGLHPAVEIEPAAGGAR